MIRFVDIPMGSGGGVRCVECHGPAVPARYSGRDEIASAIELAIAEWKGRPGPNLAFGGPEPFGHADLPALVAVAIDGRAQRLWIDTDASALCSPVNARGAVNAGVRGITVALLGAVEETHDAISGEPGALAATLDGVRSFADAARVAAVEVAVTVVVPVCRHNVSELPAIVGRAVEAGAQRVVVRVEDGTVDLSSARALLTAACDTGVVNGAWVEVAGVPFCLMRGWELHLADIVRARAGGKSPVCRACPLDDVCGGAPEGASADVLADLSPPAGADELARCVRAARGQEASDA